MATVKHGTISGYANGCTAECCLGAWREYHREYRKMRREKAIRAAEHGTIGRYMYDGCRCQLCRDAKRLSREKRVVG